MKQQRKMRRGAASLNSLGLHSSSNCGEPVRGLIAKAKDAVLRDFGPLAGEHGRLVRLALNEAEALAWQTNHPHLFFPTLAIEKAQAAVNWHQRQRAVRRGASELAFAE